MWVQNTFICIFIVQLRTMGVSRKITEKGELLISSAQWRVDFNTVSFVQHLCYKKRITLYTNNRPNLGNLESENFK